MVMRSSHGLLDPMIWHSKLSGPSLRQNTLLGLVVLLTGHGHDEQRLPPPLNCRGKLFRKGDAFAHEEAGYVKVILDVLDVSSPHPATHTQTQTVTDRHTQTHRRTQSQTHKHAHRHTDTQTHKHRYTDTQTQIHRHRYPETHRHTQRNCSLTAPPLLETGRLRAKLLCLRCLSYLPGSPNNMRQWRCVFGRPQETEPRTKPDAHDHNTELLLKHCGVVVSDPPILWHVDDRL